MGGRLVNINVKEYVDQIYSNEDGFIIYNELKKKLKEEYIINVSFKGIYALNSSFVNSAFLELLNDYDFNYIKSHLNFIDSTKQINEMIKSRFQFEVNKFNNS